MPKGDVPTRMVFPHPALRHQTPAYDRQGVAIDDLIDFTPELRAEALKLIADHRIRPALHASDLQQMAAPAHSIVSPMATARRNGRGGALDPETNILYLFSNLNYGPLANSTADPKVTDQAMVSGMSTPPDGRGGRRG